jgi:hypothetical protein
MKQTFEDLARQGPAAAECAAVALFRRDASRHITFTERELLEATQFQLVGETSADGKSLTFTLEKKVKIL